MKTVRTLMLGVAASCVLATGAMAADLTSYSAPYVAPTAPAYAGGYGFEGFYAGVVLGGFFDGTSSYLTAPDTSAVNVGLAVGVNFYLTDSVLAGVEVQGGAEIGATATTYDALALAKVGFAPSDDYMVYAVGGAGVVGASSVYAFGGGVEMAMMDSIGVRGEVLGLGKWGAAPDSMKATVGVIWHMQ